MPVAERASVPSSPPRQFEPDLDGGDIPSSRGFRGVRLSSVLRPRESALDDGGSCSPQTRSLSVSSDRRGDGGDIHHAGGQEVLGLRRAGGYLQETGVEEATRGGLLIGKERIAAAFANPRVVPPGGLDPTLVEQTKLALLLWDRQIQT